MGAPTAMNPSLIPAMPTSMTVPACQHQHRLHSEIRIARYVSSHNEAMTLFRLSQHHRINLAKTRVSATQCRRIIGAMGQGVDEEWGGECFRRH